MYVVVCQIVISFLSTLDSRFAITFDGWSNNSLKGFYPMTLHWISLEFGKPISVLLDLLDFFPIDGLVWKCIKKNADMEKTFFLRINALLSCWKQDHPVALFENVNKLIALVPSMLSYLWKYIKICRHEEN